MSAVGTLWMVATPIGNLEDITLRALRILKEVAVIACEDTRVTRKLLNRYEIETRCVSCREHNERTRSAELVERLLAGEDVAFVTDAGTPCISDPGRLLAATAAAAGVPVVAVPGPSAVLAALSTAGLIAVGQPSDGQASDGQYSDGQASDGQPSEGHAADGFRFFGFAPAHGRDRQRTLDDVVDCPVTAVLFEAPHRIVKTLASLAERAPERRASLQRELTKLHEEVIRGSLQELAASVSVGPVRGEYVLVVAPGERTEAPSTLAAAVDLARQLVEQGATPSAAARRAAAGSGLARRDIYRALLTDPGADPTG